MSELNILQLDDYCLSNILKYLNWKERSFLMLVCKRFRIVLQQCRSIHEKKFALENGWWFRLMYFTIIYKNIKWCDMNAEHIVHFIYKSEQYYRRNIFPDTKISEMITNMTALEGVKLNLTLTESLLRADLIQMPQRFFFIILLALTRLPKLKRLYINGARVWPIEIMKRFKHIEELVFDGTVCSEDLAEFCQSNANLRALRISEPIRGDLKDVLKHCQNLEDLRINMITDITSCTAIGELPKLKILKIIGYHRAGSLRQLFIDLASKAQLQVLVLDHQIVSFFETTHIVCIKSLRHLRCRFTSARSVALLPLLTNLRLLYFTVMNSPKVTVWLLHILKNCRNLKVLKLGAENIGSGPEADLFYRVIKNRMSTTKLRTKIIGRN